MLIAFTLSAFVPACSIVYMYSYFSFVGFKKTWRFDIVVFDKKFIPSPFDDLCELDDRNGELECAVRGQVDEQIFCESKGNTAEGETITCWQAWKTEPIFQVSSIICILLSYIIFTERSCSSFYYIFAFPIDISGCEDSEADRRSLCLQMCPVRD
jgi:hypothetical protein